MSGRTNKSTENKMVCVTCFVILRCPFGIFKLFL